MRVSCRASAEAKNALEVTHAEDLATCASQYDLQRMCEMHQTELANVDCQHEQESEHLRVKWVLELKVWGDSVAVFSDHFNHKIPDACWLSDLLRKGHRAQRCYDTAIELEKFLTNWCADPSQALPPDMWNTASACANSEPPEQHLESQEVHGGVAARKEDNMPEDEKSRDVDDGKQREKEKGREKKKKEEEERKRKEMEDKKKKEAADAAVDESCPLYRCSGCDKVFAVRGMLSVSDLSGLNVGTKRYHDSKSARAARDAHRKDSHPSLSDAPPAPVAHESTAAAIAVPVSSPRRNVAHEESAGDAGKRWTIDGMKEMAEGPGNSPDLGIRRHVIPGVKNNVGPKDPRLARTGDQSGSGVVTASTNAHPAARRVPTEDFISVPATGAREHIDGYVYKYGSSGPGYYRLVSAETVAQQSVISPSVRAAHSMHEQHSGSSYSTSTGASGAAPSSSGGKKTIAEVIQERTRQKEDAEKDRIRKELEDTVRMEAEARLREELRQMKEQLERDRILAQKQKETEERERERKQQREDEHLRAELRAMKEQLDRQGRERERDWEQRRHKDSSSRMQSPPRMPRGITMEDRMSARVPSPPSPRRERVRRPRDDEEMEEGEIKEESPPRPSPSRGHNTQVLNAHTLSTYQGQQNTHEHRAVSPRSAPPSAACESNHDVTTETVEPVEAKSAVQAVESSLNAENSVDADNSLDAENSIDAENSVDAEVLEGADSGKEKSGTKRKSGKSAVKCSSRQHVVAAAAAATAAAAAVVDTPDGIHEGKDVTNSEVDKEVEKVNSPPSMHPPCHPPCGEHAVVEEKDNEDAASAHSDDQDKNKDEQLSVNVKGKRKGAKGKRKAAVAPSGVEAMSRMSKSAMLKEFSRTEVRAGEALLTLYDYYFTAAQQLETAKVLNGAPASAAQIGNSLVQKELDDAVATRIQVDARIKGKWKALKGGLTWYVGKITRVNRDETVDLVYDDGDPEHNVPLRFVQLLDKQPNSRATSSKSHKRKGAPTPTAGGRGPSKRRVPPAFLGKAASGEMVEGDVEMRTTSALDAFLGTGDDQEVTSAKGRKNGNGKARGKPKARAVGVAGAARQSKARLVVQELPDAQHDKPLEECLLILNAVLGTKVAAPLLIADSTKLFPLIVKSSIQVLGKNAEKAPMDFVTIQKHLTKTCKTLAATCAAAKEGAPKATAAAKVAGHYRTAQQVREDVVRLNRLVNESWTGRQALRVCCTKVFEAFNDLFEARIVPPCHQMGRGGVQPFQHGWSTRLYECIDM